MSIRRTEYKREYMRRSRAADGGASNALACKRWYLAHHAKRLAQFRRHYWLPAAWVSVGDRGYASRVAARAVYHKEERTWRE